MKKKTTLEQDKLILKSFLENSIPLYIKEERFGEWELMEFYEELFNNSHDVLSNIAIDTTANSFGTGKTFIFNKEYQSHMMDISNKTDDVDLKIHCYLSLAVLWVLKKYTK
ncbi:MAG: hypothetical protein LBU61_00465 [Coriobacteriales bacterium]|jgi:hypothetical protein|nr:hypothetical protein [Coriobacteriales bacterium]